MSNNRKIITHYDIKPIPTRSFDWCTWYENKEYGCGFGKTEEQAINDLKKWDDMEIGICAYCNEEIYKDQEYRSSNCSDHYWHYGCCE